MDDFLPILATASISYEAACNCLWAGAIDQVRRNDLPFAYPLLWLGRFFLALSIRIVQAGAAYRGRVLVRIIVTAIGAYLFILSIAGSNH